MRQSLFRWMPFSSFSTVNVKGGPYNFVDGQKTDSMDSNGFTNVLNPATSKRLAKIAVSGVSDVDMAVKSSKKAYDSWSMVLFSFKLHKCFLVADIVLSCQVLKEENWFLSWGTRY